jgi:hypothetical protein
MKEKKKQKCTCGRKITVEFLCMGKNIKKAHEINRRILQEKY